MNFFKLNPFKNYSQTDKRIIASGIIGNLLDSYDVMICAFLAQVLVATFSPSSSIKESLVNISIMFFVSYMARPFGSIISGLFADQVGRKKMLIISLIAVAFGTFMISIIPSYNSIGISAYILFLTFRIIQNLSAGSEYISSLTYVSESTNSNRRGFFGSWVAFGHNTGTLLASIFAFFVMYLINLDLIPSWSWRLIFLTSIIGLLVGLKIRYSLPESLEFVLENAHTAPPKKVSILNSTKKLIRNHPVQCLSIFAITWLGVCVTFFVFIYSTIHLSTINHFSQHDAIGINAVSLLSLIMSIPVFGFLSDRFNRISMLIISSVAFILLSIPCYWLLSYGSFNQVLFFKIFYSIPAACYFSVAPVVIIEAFPTKIRCTATAFIYQTAASLAAGLTPFIATLCIKITASPVSPGYFLALCAFLGIVALFTLQRNPIRGNNFSLYDINPVSDPSGKVVVFK